MVAMAEELGLEMAIRSLEHLLQYGEQNIRHAVPLALGLLCISNPKVFIFLALASLQLGRFSLLKLTLHLFPFQRSDMTAGGLIRKPAHQSSWIDYNKWLFQCFLSFG